MRTTAELREGFLSFFESKGHRRLASASVVPPPDDPTTLFIIAGMQPMKRWFVGAEEPPSRLLTSVQKCMRAGGKHNDLDDLGRKARSASFFEMLGNFSIGEYFKDGAVDLAWEFVIEHMGFPADRLWATVFAGDPELGLGLDETAIEAWVRVGIPRERIRAEPRVENFWQIAETGPCGPNSEIFLDRGEEFGCGRPDCGPNCERCERFLEFWNLVFMEFELREDGSLVELPSQNVDTGMGFERAAMLLQETGSIFEIDNMRQLITWVEQRAGMAYGESEFATRAPRIVADHARASTFLIADGVIPSNEGRGYVVRRVIRRAVQYGHRLGLESPFLPELSAIVREQMAPWYPEVEEHRALVDEYLGSEEERFAETLERGLRLFDEVATGDGIAGEDAFKLHDTYGFPLELTRELAQERGLVVDEETFTRLMAEQRERSRGAGGFERELRLAGGPPSEFVGYERTEVLTAITALEALPDGLFEAKLEQSPFYPEGGGQVSDVGFIQHEETGARAELVRAVRLGEDQVLVFQGEGFAEGDRVRAVVPWSVRFPTMANHTATHLLHRALQEVLGEHARQAGSAVRPDKLRFDFTHPQALTPDEREEIEQQVNRKVWENLPVRAFLTPLEEARNLGAMMLFGEKYGDEVRVVEIPGYSRELCGGTHVRSTAEIGPFVVLTESSVGAGVRRIEAVTAGEAWAYLRARAAEADELRGELERARRERPAEAPAARAVADAPPPRVRRVGDANVVVSALEGWNADELLELSDRLKNQHRPAAVVVGSSEDGRVHLVANFDGLLVERGLNASDVVREAAALVGGGGGGRPTMARAGGRDPAKLADALEAAEQAVVARLGL
jgi:alanyl-tRNA synthetase